MRKSKQIRTLIAAPAMGKTHAVINHLSTTSKRAVIACKSIALLQQTLKDLEGMCVPSIGIHSKNAVYSVGFEIESALAMDVQVIVCTHDGLFAVKDTLNCCNRDLYVDEVPSIAEFAHLEIEPVDLCMDEWELIENKEKTAKYKLSDSAAEIPRRIKAKRDNHNIGSFSDKNYGLMAALSDGQTVYVDKSANKVSYIRCTPVDNWFLMFESVTVMAANLINTMEGKLLMHLHNYELIDSKLKLSRSGYSNLGRITLYPLIQGFNYSKYLEKKPFKDGTVFNELQRVALDIVGGERHIYTPNKENQTPNNDGWGMGELVPYSPHGRNDLIDYTNVIALFRYNPDSQGAKMLRSFGESLGIGNELYDSFITSKYLEPVFQLLTRSNIRDMNGHKECKFIVPDFRVVDYLVSGWLKGVNVDDSYVVSLPKEEKKISKKETNHLLWNAELVNLYEQNPKISGRKAANELTKRLGDDAPKHRTCSNLLTKIKQQRAA
jgi:hypothetical protein